MGHLSQLSRNSHPRNSFLALDVPFQVVLIDVRCSLLENSDPLTVSGSPRTPQTPRSPFQHSPSSRRTKLANSRSGRLISCSQVAIEVCYGRHTLARHLQFGGVGAREEYSPLHIAFTSVRTNRLPREAKVHVEVCWRLGSASASGPGSGSAKLQTSPSSCKDPECSLVMARGSFNVFDEDGIMRAGAVMVPLWRLHSGTQRPTGPSAAVGSVQIDVVVNALADDRGTLALVRHTLPPPAPEYISDDCTSSFFVNDSERTDRITTLEHTVFCMLLREMNPLYAVTEDNKRTLIQYRDALRVYPGALPKVLNAFNYDPPSHLAAAHRLLDVWTPLGPDDAISMLDEDFMDIEYRAYAVSRLQSLPDLELKQYMLQLVEVLRYETYDQSPLARFLLDRATSNMTAIGDRLYWYLKAAIGGTEGDVQLRYIALADVLLNQSANGGDGRIPTQLSLVTTLTALAEKAKTWACESSSERTAMLQDELRHTELPQRFHLPITPTFVGRGAIIERCKVLDSKKMPLWLCFEGKYNGKEDISKEANGDDTAHEEGEEAEDGKGEEGEQMMRTGTGKKEVKDVLYVIFKTGDDLRQDQLILNLLRLMQNLWKSEGVAGVEMEVYDCIATSADSGFIEVVTHAATINSIAKAQGGGVRASLSEEPIAKWLRSHNTSDEEWERAVDRFVGSCAGSCVATYVLGIGDRHSDNIMLRNNGTLFHIDFGHILGNVKYKFGVKRERAPFVFTPDYAYVMGRTEGEPFKRFVRLCGQAFNVLRKHSTLLINLLVLMTHAGLPELSSKSRVHYVREALCLCPSPGTSTGMTDEQAAAHFARLIQKSLHCRSTQLNNAVHMLAH